MNKGSREVKYSTLIGGLPDNNLRVYAEREAFLDGDLKNVFNRRLIKLHLMIFEGFSNEVDLPMRRDMMIEVRDILTEAINQTEGESDE